LSVIRRSGTGWAWLLSVPLLMAAPALATTISSPTFVDASSSGFEDIGPTGSVSGSAASLTSSGAGGFGLRYEAVVGADLGGAGGSHFTESFTGSLSPLPEPRAEALLALALIALGWFDRRRK
jgi:hypothetical protein